MASHEVWLDFQDLRYNVKHNTVDRLKQILSGLNDECGTHISKSGKKQEIIDRIVQTLDTWRQSNAVDKWTKAKAVLYQVRTSGTYTPSRTPVTNSSALHPTSSMQSSVYNSSSISKLPSYSPGSSSAGRFDPYSTHKPSGVGSISAPVTASSSSLKPAASSLNKPMLRFKDSPFFRVDQMVSNVVECPESSGAMDRRQQAVVFTLTQQQIDKLKAAGSRYQLRLFCTSSMFFSLNPSFRTYNTPCPIEFPPTCEVRVNAAPLNASLKGLKKKPGTAPPPDLSRYVRIGSTQNRVELVYVNSQQPTQAKKYYLVVQLVETTSVTTLVDSLKRDRFQTCEEIQKQIKASNTEDDDIVAGSQKMSLKCPLTLLRVNTPCRSSKCVHRQCFDATSWFSVMEQTTTWLCPVCEQVLDTNDLIIDGYFETILKACPDSVEDVIVEADGEWHTSDNKYASMAWKIKHPPEKPKPSSLSRKPNTFSPTKAMTPSGINSGSYLPNGEAKKPAVEVMVLDDSDDEDEGRVKRELSPSLGMSRVSLPPQTQSQDAVIDLTLDSDDDEPPRPPPVKETTKRKATEALSPTETIWKKGRTDPDRTSSSTSVNSANSHQHSSLTSAPSASTSANANVSATIRYPYNNGPQVTSAFTFGRNSSSGSGVFQLPPPPRGYSGYQNSSQVNGTTNPHWS